MVFEFLEAVFNALTKWSDAPNLQVPEGPFASVDDRKNREEESEEQD